MKSRSLITVAAWMLCAGVFSLFGAEKFITYEEFGAVGDGKTDDMKAIAAAHAAANEKGLPVKATAGKTYFIKDVAASAIIQTDTDFGTAKFIIDDSDAFQQRNTPPFHVARSAKAVRVTKKIPALKAGQKNVGFAPGFPAMIFLANSRKRHYIRFGGNRNKGDIMIDTIRVDKDGNVDPSTPVLWDFDHVSKAEMLPIEEKVLTVQGGHFTTIANQAPPKYTSFKRGIAVERSRTVVRNVRHEIKGEGKQGAPYSGFIHVNGCSFVLIEDCKLTGHKTYYGIGSAGVMVANGSYDISLNRTLDVTLRRCIQLNDIQNTKYWGILASNHCKNILFDHCVLSRYDSHRGVHNVTILDSTLGHAGVAATGSGLLRLERTTVRSRNFIRFRADYGATWRGNVVIRDCTFVGNSAIFCMFRNLAHDFGHPCAMPTRITIDGLKCQFDPKAPKKKTPGPMVLFLCGYDKKLLDQSGLPAYPRIKELEIRNFRTADGKPMLFSDQPEVFKDLKITGDVSSITR